MVFFGWGDRTGFDVIRNKNSGHFLGVPPKGYIFFAVWTWLRLLWSSSAILEFGKSFSGSDTRLSWLLAGLPALIPVCVCVLEWGVVGVPSGGKSDLPSLRRALSRIANDM